MCSSKNIQRAIGIFCVEAACLQYWQFVGALTGKCAMCMFIYVLYNRSETLQILENQVIFSLSKKCCQKFCSNFDEGDVKDKMCGSLRSKQKWMLRCNWNFSKLCFWSNKFSEFCLKSGTSFVNLDHKPYDSGIPQQIPLKKSRPIVNERYLNHSLYCNKCEVIAD